MTSLVARLLTVFVVSVTAFPQPIGTEADLARFRGLCVLIHEHKLSIESLDHQIKIRSALLSLLLKFADLEDEQDTLALSDVPPNVPLEDATSFIASLNSRLVGLSDLESEKLLLEEIHESQLELADLSTRIEQRKFSLEQYRTEWNQLTIRLLDKLDEEGAALRDEIETLRATIQYLEAKGSLAAFKEQKISEWLLEAPSSADVIRRTDESVVSAVEAYLRGHEDSNLPEMHVGDRAREEINELIRSFRLWLHSERMRVCESKARLIVLQRRLAQIDAYIAEVSESFL